MLKPADIVARQLKEYNEKNLEGFISLFSESIQGFDLKSGERLVNGKQQLIERYKSRFDSSPNLYSKILNRLEIGNTIIDHEHITGFDGDKTINLVAIYEINDNLISKMWFIRED